MVSMYVETIATGHFDVFQLPSCAGNVAHVIMECTGVVALGF